MVATSAIVRILAVEYQLLDLSTSGFICTSLISTMGDVYCEHSGPIFLADVNVCTGDL